MRVMAMVMVMVRVRDLCNYYGLEGVRVRQQMDRKRDRVDTSRMDKTTGKTYNKMGR